jgi:hypothetical protein
MRASRLFCRPGLVLGACFFSLAAADELKEPPKEISDEQRAKHLAHMKDVAASIRLLADPRREDSAVKLVDKPILRYSDNTRLTHESSLWIWSAGGRPSAVLAVEYYPQAVRGPRWLYEIASLSTERIAAQRDPDLRWTAKEPGLHLRAFKGVDPPAEKAARRLTQMKELHRRFTAHERGSLDGRIELRPLSSPLFRYSDADAGILDGAIFAFVNGTNPEALLVLEAHTTQAGASTWHYGLVQMTGEPVVVELDGKEVWKRDQADPPAVRESYVNGWISSETKEK